MGGTGMCWGEIDRNSGSVYFPNMQGGGSIWSCLVCVENGNSRWIIYFKLIVCVEFFSYPSCKYGPSCTVVTQLYLRFVQIKNIDKRHNLPWASVGWRWSIIEAKLFLFLHWRSKLPTRKWSFLEFNSAGLMFHFAQHKTGSQRDHTTCLTPLQGNLNARLVLVSQFWYWDHKRILFLSCHHQENTQGLDFELFCRADKQY